MRTISLTNINFSHYSLDQISYVSYIKKILFCQRLWIPSVTRGILDREILIKKGEDFGRGGGNKWGKRKGKTEGGNIEEKGK